MLGKDAAKSEYWHFKDDNTRLYIRMENEVPVNGDVIPAEENAEIKANNEDVAVEGNDENGQANAE